MRPIVVIDTNMLLVPFQFGVDVFEEIQRLVPGAKLVIVRGTMDELERVAKQGRKEEKYVRLAKRLIEMRRIEIVNREGPVDRVLVEMAREGAIVATNDRELKKKVWAVGGKVISLREKNRLELF